MVHGIREFNPLVIWPVCFESVAAQNVMATGVLGRERLLISWQPGRKEMEEKAMVPTPPSREHLQRPNFFSLDPTTQIFYLPTCPGHSTKPFTYELLR